MARKQIKELNNGTFALDLEQFFPLQAADDTEATKVTLAAFKEIIISAIGDVSGTDGTDGTDGLTPVFATEDPWENTSVEGQEGAPALGIAGNGDVYAGHAVADTTSPSEWVPTGINLKGPAGKSAYQVAVDGGFVGDEAAWLASLVGGTGPTGGSGEPGSSYWRGEFNITTSYPAGVIVSYEGKYYLLTEESDWSIDGLPDVNPKWVLLAPEDLGSGNGTISAGNITLDGGLMAGYPTGLQDWAVQVFNDIAVLKADMLGKFSGVTDPAIACTVDNGRIVSQ